MIFNALILSKVFFKLITMVKWFSKIVFKTLQGFFLLLAECKLFVLLSPVGPYYASGFKPVNLLCDPAYVR